MIFVLLFFLSAPAHASTLHIEKVYAQVWCDRNGGITEVVLTGKTRVDCLTETHAVEVEFAHKWQEAIGQALYYGKKTGRAPGIVLIKESPEDQKYLGRLIYTIRKNYPFIRLWVIKPEDV